MGGGGVGGVAAVDAVLGDQEIEGGDRVIGPATRHGQGASLSSQELIKKATGKALTAAPWLRYAESKYLEQGG
jgi:hypothetical protein